MKKEIKLIKNNNSKDWEDLQWINEFYEFLQGTEPESITLGRGSRVKLTQKQAFSVIWYLKEHLRVFPDQIDRCSICGDLYDSYSDGHYSEKTGKHFCGHCDTYHNTDPND